MTKSKSDSLTDFFNTVDGEKKKLKEEKSKIIGDLSLDNLFSTMEEESRKIKKQKKQLKKDVEAFKKILFKEDKKERTCCRENKRRTYCRGNRRDRSRGRDKRRNSCRTCC